jgi:hypothetical protein
MKRKTIKISKRTLAFVVLGVALLVVFALFIMQNNQNEIKYSEPTELDKAITETISYGQYLYLTGQLSNEGKQKLYALELYKIGVR